MKTIRTILATFGATSLLYGLLALISMRLDLAFTGRSIFQLFRSTGFAALVLGIGCILSFVIMTIAIVAFRDDSSRRKRDIFEDEDDESFLEEETVPEERADEADETWSPEIKRKQRKALLKQREDEDETPDLFADDEDEPSAPVIEVTPRGEQQKDPEPQEPEPLIEPEFDPEETPVEVSEDEPEEDREIEPEETPVGAAETEPEKARVEAPEDEPEQAPETESEDAHPTKRCPRCGATIDADSAFCNFCGNRV